jgi:hypothetical protein
MKMAEIEYQEDLDAFKELYKGLADRFNEILIQRNTPEIDDFKLDYLSKSSWLGIFLASYDTGIVRIPGNMMSHALEKLVEMNRDLRKFLGE